MAIKQATTMQVSINKKKPTTSISSINSTPTYGKTPVVLDPNGYQANGMVSSTGIQKQTVGSVATPSSQTTIPTTVGGANTNATVTSSSSITEGAKPGVETSTTATPNSVVTEKETENVNVSNNSSNTNVSTSNSAVAKTQSNSTTIQPLSKEDYFAEAEAIAKKQKNEAIASAEEARKKAYIDADTSYKQNLATYGTNAERLADLGLNYSGYSDYLNAQAYATSQGAKQSAEAIKSATLRDAENSYASNILNIKKDRADYAEATAQDHKSNYDKLLSYANSGEYTGEQIKELSSMYGLSQEEANSLSATATSKYDETLTNKKNSSYATLFDAAKSGNYSAEEIKEMATREGFTDEEITKLTASAQDATFQTILEGVLDGEITSYDYQDILDSVASGDITEAQATKITNQIEKGIQEELSGIDIVTEPSSITQWTQNQITALKNNGKISAEEYEAWVQLWDNYSDEGAFNGGNQDQAQALKHLNLLKASKYLSPSKKSELEKKYNEYYNSGVKSNVVFNTSGGKSEEANKFSLKDDEGNVYRVKKGNEVSDTTIVNAANNERRVFVINSKAYIKLDGKVFEVVARQGFDGQWEDLMKVLGI